MNNKINIGIIGFGTVGTGTVKILFRNKDIIKERSGIEIIIKKIADSNIQRDRGIKIPQDILTTDARAILNDPEIDIIVELIGGIHPAKDFILEAIKNKKHIVTANKALLATEGNDIFAQALQNQVKVGFEATVAGGIPIIKIIKEGLVANNFIAIYGIINGTSNYILSKMTDEKAEFQDVLKDAQRLGYAEADPQFDIEGIDTAHKLTILSSLAFGIPLSYNKVYKEGITKITAQDIEFAAELGYKIKLLAITKSTSPSSHYQGGGEVQIRVHPTMIPMDHLISKVDGIFNAVYVEGDAVGSTLYYGKGAGDMPTGSAIVSDIVDIGKTIISKGHFNNCAFVRSNTNLKITQIGDIESRYYFRFRAVDKPGVLSKISGIFGKYNISIASVIQKDRKIGETVPLVIITYKAKEKDVLEAIKEIEDLQVISNKVVFIRIEGKEE